MLDGRGDIIHVWGQYSLSEYGLGGHFSRGDIIHPDNGPHRLRRRELFSSCSVYLLLQVVIRVLGNQVERYGSGEQDFRRI